MAAAGAASLAGCATPAAELLPPILFVHGNGDSAALWTTVVWRFESNGWPRERLLAIDLPYPQSRDIDAVPQAGRSSADEQARFLAGEVDRLLASTGATRLVMYGNSRGGNAIRHYVQNFGGAAKVSHAILGGATNHGVWADAADRPGSEFNGAGPFLLGLNAPKGPDGDEVTPGPRWLTLRSDNNDKYAQPDGRWIGAPGKPTNVTYDGPALKGALNKVLPGRDHHEVAFHAEAFAMAFEFLSGRAPRTLVFEREDRVVLDGLVGGATAAGPTNLPLTGATVEVFAVDAASGARLGPVRHRKTVAADGRWGPFVADPETRYEFVIGAPGLVTTHVYRSPFPRSSNLVHFRLERLADAERGAAAVLGFTRPRGYFSVPRDRIVFDGLSPPPGVSPGVAGIGASRLRLADGAGRAVVAEFDSGAIRERLVGRAWPAAENRVTVLEMHE